MIADGYSGSGRMRQKRGRMAMELKLSRSP